MVLAMKGVPKLKTICPTMAPAEMSGKSLLDCLTL